MEQFIPAGRFLADEGEATNFAKEWLEQNPGHKWLGKWNNIDD